MKNKNKQSNATVNNDETFVKDCYEYMTDFAKTIYENETRREDSLIQQASHMQTAFSFVIAAVLMLLPVVIDYRGILSFRLVVTAFSTIVITLLFSLFAATMAQNRVKREDYPSVSTIKTKVINEYMNFETEAQRNKYLLDTYEKMHDSYSKTNDTRRLWVKTSMTSFYVSLILCIFWFVVMICKVI